VRIPLSANASRRGRACAFWAFFLVLASALTATDSSAGEMKLRIRPPVPALVGPDTVEPAPVLVLDDERAELDGRPVTPDELGSTLRTLAGNYKLLHPDGSFNGKILVACAPKTSMPRLSEHLRVALAAGFPNPMFLLIQPDPAATTDRSADRITGAITTLKKDAAATPLKVREQASCESLAKAVIAKRNHGKAVFLELGPEESPRSSRGAPQPKAPAGHAGRGG
jgi:hypothetical protein